MSDRPKGPGLDAITSRAGLPCGVPDQRRRSRVDFSVPALIRVMIEEETFRPLRLGGRTRNLSATGMLVQIDAITEADYKTLIRRQRMIRVHTKLPGNDEELVYFGKVVCYDYHRGEGDKSVCLVGIGFEELPEREQHALTVLLDNLMGGDPKSPKSSRSEANS